MEYKEYKKEKFTGRFLMSKDEYDSVLNMDEIKKIYEDDFKKEFSESIGVDMATLPSYTTASNYISSAALDTSTCDDSTCYGWSTVGTNDLSTGSYYVYNIGDSIGTNTISIQQGVPITFDSNTNWDTHYDTSTGNYTLTYNGSAWIQGDVFHFTPNKVDVKEEVKRAIRNNLLIKIGTRHNTLQRDVSPQELKARQTLRDIITEKEWRRYVTNGFIMVKGQSGKWYQIFKDQNHTKVYNQGRLIEEICIHTDQKCPPTDHILNLKLLIELDENSLRAGGNIYYKDSQTYPYYNKNIKTKNMDRDNLVSIFDRYKKAA